MHAVIRLALALRDTAGAFMSHFIPPPPPHRRRPLIGRAYKDTLSSSSSSMALAGSSSSAPVLQMTLGLIKPTVCSYQPDVSAILRRIKTCPAAQAGRLTVVRQRRLFWTTREAEEFYGEHKGRFYYDRLIAGMTSGPSMALALAGEDVIATWRAMLGPTKAYRAKWEEPPPQGLRATYGLGDTRNGFHGSDSHTSALRELGQVFEGFAVEAWLADEQARRSQHGQS